jgi:UMF1 family MFS transporter
MTNEKRWLLYDWANSVFATSVVAAFFPIVLRSYWAKGLDSQTVTFRLGLTNSLISFLLFLILPLMGFAIDRKIKSHQNVLFFTAVCGGFLVALLFLVNEGSSIQALLLYGASFIFFALGNTQCDAMLFKLQKENPKRNLGNLSSLGYLYGYLGGGILLTLQSLTLIFYKQIGFESALLPAKLCFLTAGLWWIAFSTPLLGIKFKEKAITKTETKTSVLKDYKSFLLGLDKKSVLYLVSFFLYIDVVFTTYKMAVDFGLSMGLSQNHLIAILIYVQLIGVPGTLLMNKIADLFSVKTALNVGLAMFAIVIACSPLVKSLGAFAALATFIGISQGGIQALSRSHFANITHEDQQGIGFSFINVFGKLSAILGPLIVGATAYLLGDNTYSFFTLLPLLILGVWFLNLSFKENQAG